jgi:hypothetical protein
LLNSHENRAKVIKGFPNLKNDKIFEIIDGENPNFNCIAYAAHVTNCWWWPLPKERRPAFFAGVKYNWPFNAEDDTSLDVLISIFENLDYIKCENFEYEEGYKKIALYVKNDEISHAARQLTYGKRKGKWSSKLGTSFTILHETPQSIEGNAYGQAVCFMKKSMN